MQLKVLLVKSNSYSFSKIGNVCYFVSCKISCLKQIFCVCVCVCVCVFARVYHRKITWFSQQEHWSGLLPFPPPRDLPNPGITPVSLCLLRWQVDSLPPAPPVLIHTYTHVYIDKMKTLEFILALSGSNMIPLCLFKSFFFPNLYILFLTLRNPTSHCLQSIHFLVQG